MTIINNFFGFVKNGNGKIIVNFGMMSFQLPLLFFSKTFHNSLLLRIKKKETGFAIRSVWNKATKYVPDFLAFP